MAADTLINDFELPFQLYDVLGVEHLTEHAKFVEHSRETFDAVLGTANKIATQLFLPHNHVADNDLDIATCKLIAKRQDACGITTGQLFMLDRVGMLNIEQHHIGLVEYGIELLGMRGIERIAAAIQAGMHAAIGVVVHCTEQVGQKLRL